VVAALTFGITVYFYVNSFNIHYYGWTPPTNLNLALAVVLCIVVLEGARRTAGTVYFVICLVFALYPLYAEYMPGLLFGKSFPFRTTIGLYAFGSESLIGLPVKVMGEILIGFLIFAGMLIVTGAGDFFLNLAFGLLGRYRGGAAKVAVLASGFFGSLSGSVVSNVVATGSITIPAMKKLGYPPHYAGAIEACASTGGALMPPIMGAVAFVMATLLSVDYLVIITGAAIPAILYYFGLLMQVDAYAAKNGLKGLPKEEIPSLKKTLKQGWQFVAVFAFLIWGLIYMRWEALTPFYASGLLLVLCFTRRSTMLTPRALIQALATVGKLITQVVGLLFPVGLIIGALLFTGMSPSFTAGIVAFGGGNLFLILLLGVAACYIMGMAGLSLVAYIFLAITMAPALMKVAALNLLAVHLFIAYYDMMSLITLPVAGAVFVASPIANATPMKTGWQAMRLGVVLYFIPIFFLFNPALILQGPSLLESFYLFGLCLLGIALIAGGLEGYLLKVGRLSWWSRTLLIIAGFLIAFPGYGQILTLWMTTIIGAALASSIIAITLKMKKTAAERLLT
jgi:TRAP transporter 4TM/12TM fusion protein